MKNINENHIAFTLHERLDPTVERIVYLDENEAFLAQEESALEMGIVHPVRSTLIRPDDDVQDYGSSGADYLADVEYMEHEAYLHAVSG